ncbi:MAG: hypothetical protein FJX77_11420 [Armatimonadetes bacterium]|nr:hypothetical protein [Armatimonadota bacterium]
MERRSLLAGALGAALLPRAVAAQHSASGWEARLNALLPTPEEDRWLSIPWRTNLLEAIAEGGRAGKPVMAWIMNGNPLGCG